MVRRLALAAYLVLVAAGCSDAWRTPDQQGRILYERGEYAAAAEVFRDPMWRGAALVAAKEFEAAAGEFAMSPTREGFYDRGVCLSLLGRYEEAVEEFEAALNLDTAFEDARFNRDLVARILEARNQEQERPETESTHYEPDEIRFDEKGKQGEETEDEGPDGQELAAEMWLRQVRTTPADFLKRKFAVQAAGEKR